MYSCLIGLSFWRTAADPPAGCVRTLHCGSWKLLISATDELHQGVSEEEKDTVPYTRSAAAGFCVTDEMILKVSGAKRGAEGNRFSKSTKIMTMTRTRSLNDKEKRFWSR